MYARFKMLTVLMVAFLAGTTFATRRNVDDHSTLGEIMEANERNSENMNKLFEGDIMPSKNKSSGQGNVASYDVIYNGKWQNGIVPYTISTSSNGDRAVIISAMQEIQAATCIQFVERTNQRDYIQIYRGIGCWSYVGRQGGKQDVSIGDRCGYKYIVIHELFHVLGFRHEQMRFDRNSYVTVNYQNIKYGKESNFEKIAANKAQSYGVAYDKQSIMHYGQYAFSILPEILKTIESKTNPNEYLGGKVMTASDIKQMNLHYGCSVNKECNDKFDACKHVKRWCSAATTIRKDCPLTCDDCPVVTTTTTTTTTTTPAPCVNYRHDVSCDYWEKLGFCTQRFVSYMTKYCRKSCNLC